MRLWISGRRDKPGGEESFTVQQIAALPSGEGVMRHEKALWPIIYVRGYAMTEGEIEATTADPFCGFNLGSTVYRAAPDKKAPPRKFIFESPVVRLGSDYGYSCIFDAGADLFDPDWTKTCIPARSIVIYRYYDEASRLLGSGETPPIEKFAEGLGTLILRVRELVCADPEAKIARRDFRCYLIAHSMGGLVCRAFLQNPKLGVGEAKKCVDKVFTYATPHNGIDMAGINVPRWLTANDISNFSRSRMSEYLNLKKHGKERVDWLPEDAFPSERFFCMIGTNRADYEAGFGLSRTFAGHGSDGLVRVANASVWGMAANGQVSAPCATAYAYRSHSGYFGIVNSEEAYQNLVRFLFGDVRVDMWLKVDEVRLPDDVEKAFAKGKKVEALYQFELLAAPRGKRWYLTRRVAEEDSVACRTLDQLRGNAEARSSYLSTVFLSRRARVNPKRESLAYAITLGVRVPDYEVEGRFWSAEHYEGGYIFRDTVIVELTPPKTESGEWKVSHAWESTLGVEKSVPLAPKSLDEGIELDIPFEAPGSPGITGRLRLLARPWNN
jgi:hypothetical protein